MKLGFDMNDQRVRDAFQYLGFDRLEANHETYYEKTIFLYPKDGIYDEYQLNVLVGRNLHPVSCVLECPTHIPSDGLIIDGYWSCSWRRPKLGIPKDELYVSDIWYGVEDAVIAVEGTVGLKAPDFWLEAKDRDEAESITQDFFRHVFGLTTVRVKSVIQGLTCREDIKTCLCIAPDGEIIRGRQFCVPDAPDAI